ncbi:uncharacterized [Tachysurus ichikawai]
MHQHCHLQETRVHHRGEVRLLPRAKTLKMKIGIKLEIQKLFFCTWRREINLRQKEQEPCDRSGKEREENPCPTLTVNGIGLRCFRPW